MSQLNKIPRQISQLKSLLLFGLFLWLEKSQNVKDSIV